MEVAIGPSLALIAIVLAVGIGLIVAAAAFHPRLSIIGIILGGAFVVYAGLSLSVLILAASGRWS